MQNTDLSIQPQVLTWVFDWLEYSHNKDIFILKNSSCSCLGKDCIWSLKDFYSFCPLSFPAQPPPPALSLFALFLFCATASNAWRSIYSLVFRDIPGSSWGTMKCLSPHALQLFDMYSRTSYVHPVSNIIDSPSCHHNFSVHIFAYGKTK